MSKHEKIGPRAGTGHQGTPAVPVRADVSALDVSRLDVSRRLDRRRALAALSGLVLLGGWLSSRPARAAGRVELLMFDDPGCPWCRKWRAEVGQAYSNSPEGRRAPLRTVSFRGGAPAGITLSGAVRASPTFVLVQDGREVGRLVGYGGPDFFWSSLSGLLKKLKNGQGA